MGQLEPKRGDESTSAAVAPNCMSCGTRMDIGYVTQFGAGSRAGAWSAGAPPETLGQSLATLGGEPAERHLVLAYRCAQCGLGLHYAP